VISNEASDDAVDDPFTVSANSSNFFSPNSAQKKWQRRLPSGPARRIAIGTGTDAWHSSGGLCLRCRWMRSNAGIQSSAVTNDTPTSAGSSRTHSQMVRMLNSKWDGSGADFRAPIALMRKDRQCCRSPLRKRAMRFKLVAGYHASGDDRDVVQQGPSAGNKNRRARAARPKPRLRRRRKFAPARRMRVR